MRFGRDAPARTIRCVAYRQPVPSLLDFTNLLPDPKNTMRNALIITGLHLAYVGSLLPLPASAQLIAAGAGYSVAVCNDGTARAWGWNVYGQLGNGSANASNVPVQVSFLTGITAIDGGGYHSIALRNDGTVQAWGYNVNGQLGDGTNTDSHVPVQVITLTGITAIGAGGYHSLALKNDGTVWTWGRNYHGQLGNGSNTDSNVPVQVSSLSGIIAIAAGGFHCLALKDDGTVWAWGENNYGELGNGTNTDSNFPVQVSSLAAVTAIAAGMMYHSLALKNDGTVQAWGGNGYGELGNGNTTDSNVPVQVSSLTGVTAIAAGDHHSLALKNDGTLRAWGRNYYSELGNGNNTDSNVPVQVSALTDVTVIGTGSMHPLALKNDGTVWAWGANFYGELGNGTNTASNVPVQVIGLCAMAIGVEELSDGVSVSAFPNPTTGRFIIQGASGTQQLEIRDALGREVLRSVVRGPIAEIDLSGRASGLYWIKVTDGSRIQTGKILIQ